MNKLVARSLEIMGKTTKDIIGTEYTSNLTAFINDAKNVKNSITKSTTDAADTFARLKNTNITKKISDWFYDEESKSDSGSSDDFDAGFKIDSSDDPKLDGESKPRALDADSMGDITEKQTNTMLKIGRRQTEQTVANTAEIVSAINSRSSEMIASMNNINKSLLGINERLDKLIQLNVVAAEESKKEIDKGSLFSDGKMSLMSIFEASKKSLGNNSVLSTGQMLLDNLTNGQLGPDALLKMALDMTVLNKKSNALGGKSINDIGKGFNEMIGTVTQTMMSEMVGSGFFKKIFGDLTSIDGDTDYGRLVPNHYDNKKAQFDGMTRMTIVSVIPEYLSKITEHLTGTSYHVDSKGKVVAGPAKNKFKEVVDNTFASSGLSDTAMKNIQNASKKVSGLAKKISASDITIASKALTGIIVMTMHREGRRLFNQSDLRGNMMPYIETAVQVLCYGKNDPEYWTQVCQTIIIQLSSGLMDSAQFVQNINQSLQNTISSATEFAQSGKPNASQASKLDMSMFAERFLRSNFEGEINKQLEARSKNNVDGKITPVKNRPNADKYTTHDYIRGIFGILNRGINVKTVNNPNDHKGYGNYKLERSTTDQVKEDDKFGQIVMGMMTNGGDITDQGSIVKQAANATIEAILGKDGAAAATQAVGGGGGFFSNMFGMMGAQGMNKMISRAFNGELKEDVKGLFGEDGKLSQLFGKAKTKAEQIADKTLGSYKYDKRVDQTRDAILGENGLVDKVKDKAKETGSSALEALNQNKLFANTKNTLGRVVNNLKYNADSVALKTAKSNMANFDADKFDMDVQYIENTEDRLLAEQAIQCIKFNDIEGARNFIGQMNDSSMKKALSKHLSNYDKINEINQKREAGQTALAEGKTSDIGAVLQPINGDDQQITDQDAKKGGILGIVKKGFNMVGKVLGKIAELAADGAMNLTFGLKNMAEGFFGGKKRDENGEVIRDENGKPIREKGLVQQLAIDPTKKVLSGFAKAGKFAATKVGSGIKNVATNVWLGKEQEQNVVDQNGEKVTQTVRTGGLSKMKITRSSEETVENLIKAPAETLKNVLNDVGNKFKEFGEKHFKGFIDKFKEFNKTKTKKDDGEENKPGFFGKIKNKIQESKFVQGVTKGFKEAKAAKAKMSEEKERMSTFSNRAVGNIMDVIMGKSDAPSAFSQICDLIKNFHKDVNENHEEDVKKAAEQDDENETTSTVETGQTDPTNGTQTATETVNQTTGEGGSDAQTAIKNATEGADQASDSAESSGGDTGDKKGMKGFLKGLFGDLTGNIGKIFGGFGQALLGIVEMVAAAVMALEGVQMLMDVFKNIIPTIVEPLNGIFTSLVDAIQPTIDAFTNIFSSIAETITIIVQSLIKVIAPLMDTFKTIFDNIFGVLSPILDVIIALTDIVFVPLIMAVKVIQPIIEMIGYTLQIISGVVQTGMGFIIKMLGALLTGIGHVVDKLGGDDSIVKQGKSMSEQGKTMIEAGKTSMKTGLEGLQSSVSRLLPGGEPLLGDEEEPTKTGEVNTENVNIDGGAMGSGDVDNRIITNNSYVYHSTYGSGNTVMNQHSYGNYMNMSERGCGPVALADAYSRRTGSKVNPATLASKMVGNGAYEPNRGTSVDSFVRTGNAMGMNMRVGGVTQASLKRATPNNPITLLGSGGDYGTRPGNNHYVNVIGTDKHGGAYVANPLTGRIDRRSASTLALNSKLGLYGSGDSDLYAFDDETNNALENLKNLTSKLTGMFTGDSKKDEMRKTVEAGEQADKAERIKITLGDDFSDIEKQAFDKFKENNPKHDGETESEYNDRIKKLWDKPENYNKYIVQYGGQSAYDKQKEQASSIESGFDEASTGLDSVMEALKQIPTNGSSSSSGGAGTFSSENGVVMAEYGTPKYTDINIHDYINPPNHSSGHSPLHDFFGQTNKDVAYSADGNWYGNRHTPDKYGVGSSGDAGHGGIDILWSAGSLGKEARATTGGKVTRARGGAVEGNLDANGGCGNDVQWTDSAGMTHWFMHLRDDPLVKDGDTIQPGQLLGYVGNTGHSYGAHLHYTITNDTNSSSDMNGEVNPITYFSVYNPNASKLVGSNDEERIWAYLTSNGATKMGAAGFMGVWEVESDNNPSRLEGDYKMGGVNSNQVMEAFKSQEAMNTYTQNMVQTVYNGWGSLNKKTYNPDGVNFYPGVGLAQWTGTRTKALADKAAETGTQWNDLGTQLSFWNDEVTNNSYYASALSGANSASTPEAAAEKVLNIYEGLSSNNQYAALATRQAHAKRFYELYKGADINSWPGNISSALADHGNTTTDHNAANVALDDLNEITNRQNLYIKTYRNLLSIPGLTNLEANRIFKNNLKAKGITQEILDADAEVLYPVSCYRAEDDVAHTNPIYNWAKRNASNYRFTTDTPDSPSESDSNINTFSGIVNTTSDPLNMRELPNTSSKKIAQIPKGTTLNLTYSDNDGWYGTSYNNKSGYVSSDFIKLEGSGDTGNFWYDTIFNNDSSVETDIPELDASKFQNDYDSGLQPLQTFIKKYEIKSDDTDRSQFLEKMGQMTFNVRAQRVEELLEELIEKIDGNKPKPSSSSGTDVDLFNNNSIPEPVTRLSKG